MTISQSAAPRTGYSSADLAAALRAAGLAAGDTVFFHTCLEVIGFPSGSRSTTDACRALLDAIESVIGSEGTLVVPAYTFSFCRGETFDPDESPAVSGLWNTFSDFPEYVRRLPGTLRSLDPIFSVAARGRRATELLRDLPATALGEGSIHHRLWTTGGKVCLLGTGLHETTLQHHAEALARVPWRYDKLFTGVIRQGGEERRRGWIYNVRIKAPNADPHGHRIAGLALEQSWAAVAPVGSGDLVVADAEQYMRLAGRCLASDPWFTARGPAGDPVELERARVGVPPVHAALGPDAAPGDIVRSLWHLPRDIVSDAYDAALGALASQLPMRVHQYPSGTESWTWIVPEKWTCREAWLETLDGRRLFEYADHPLHVVSYSLPFSGTVSRETLLDHLHVHPRLDDAIPFMFKYYDRDWGLCCSRTLRDSLSDASYRVHIDTEFSLGTLKVGEAVVQGEREECIVLCAHLCHTAMANDDLTGVAVGIAVMRELAARQGLRYTYRFLIVPETIGSVAYLAANEHLIPAMKGGLFLEMLGKHQPHALQRSLHGHTEVDSCFVHALREHDPTGWVGDYRTTIGNDERQFNAPGVRVPMLSLSRVLPRDAADAPYREYHSSLDTPDIVSDRSLQESVDLVLRMIDALERNRVPFNRFRGEVFCARYGVHIDWYTNPHGHRALFSVMDLVDGTRSVAEIADACGIPFGSTVATLEELERHGLIEYRAP